MDDEPLGAYLVVGTRDKPNETHPHSHIWRLWAGGTSFYIKARDRSMGAIKVSLHGPDERDSVGPPVFKFGFDRGVTDRSGVLHAEEFKGRAFPGEEVSANARRVLRIRIPWDTLRPGDPAGLGKLDLRNGMKGGVVKPPSIGYAVDLDVFVSEGKPYWPAAPGQLQRDRAAIGPFRNDAGQSLTVVSIQRALHRDPTPEEVHALPPMHRGDLVRGVFIGGPKDGPFPWIVETLTSRRAIVDPANYEPPLPITLPSRPIRLAGPLPFGAPRDQNPRIRWRASHR